MGDSGLCFGSLAGLLATALNADISCPRVVWVFSTYSYNARLPFADIINWNMLRVIIPVDHYYSAVDGGKERGQLPSCLLR